jgi:hypothetical protein
MGMRSGLRVAVAVVALLAGLSVGVWRAIASDPKPAPPRPVELRIVELESKVEILELKIQRLQAVVDRLPKPGVQPAR